MTVRLAQAIGMDKVVETASASASVDKLAADLADGARRRRDHASCA